MKILNSIFTDTKVEQKSINKTVNLSEDKISKTYTKEEEKIRDLFKKHNKAITSESIKEIKIFINKTEGSFESKLKTIETVLSKDLDLTSENLKLVHEALNGDLEEVVEKLILKPSDIKKIYQKLPKEIKKLVDKKIKDGLSLKEAIFSVTKSKIINLFNEEESLSFTQKELKASESINILEVFKETDETQNNKSSKLENKHAKINDMTGVDKSIKLENKQAKSADIIELDKSNFDGVIENNELNEDLKTLDMIENSLDALEENIDLLIESINGEIEFENIQLNVPEVSFKKIIRTEISEKMIILKKEFNNYKKYMINELNKIMESKVDTVDIKKTLVLVIDKLDDILMKSDITLHTDMKTERELLYSSTKLEDAKILLEENKIDKAIEIVKDVKVQIENIKFEPSSKKIMGISEKVFLEKLYEANIIKSIPIKFDMNPQTSPREVLEVLRGLGLNHESEVAEMLSKSKISSEVKSMSNMKTILMKLEENATTKVSAREGLDNLTGQQLLNKLEYRSQKQKMLFNIPVKIENSIKNLKVHVNAKKDNQKIDWKNSTLYFVIHLDKLGDTGILVDINNGVLNLVIKNDSKDVESKISPLLVETKERLEAAGFNSIKVRFDKLNEESIEAPIEISIEVSKYENTTSNTVERFDVKI